MYFGFTRFNIVNGITTHLQDNTDLVCQDVLKDMEEIEEKNLQKGLKKTPWPKPSAAK